MHELAERQRNIACPWRHVEHKHVQAAVMRLLTPVNIKQELLYGFLHHQAPPDDSGVGIGRGVGRRTWEKKAHGHAWQAVIRKRNKCTC